MSRFFALLLLASIAVGTTGCIVEPGGGGWCYWHPGHCR
jgi:hypothetical protein